MLLIIFGFSFLVRCSILSRIANGKTLHTDIAWDESNTIQYPALAIVAGLAAGLFGIGENNVASFICFAKL